MIEQASGATHTLAHRVCGPLWASQGRLLGIERAPTQRFCPTHLIIGLVGHEAFLRSCSTLFLFYFFDFLCIQCIRIKVSFCNRDSQKPTASRAAKVASLPGAEAPPTPRMRGEGPLLGSLRSLPHTPGKSRADAAYAHSTSVFSDRLNSVNQIVPFDLMPAFILKENSPMCVICASHQNAVSQQLPGIQSPW